MWVAKLRGEGSIVDMDVQTYVAMQNHIKYVPGLLLIVGADKETKRYLFYVFSTNIISKLVPHDTSFALYIHLVHMLKM